jgi:hypothetical protein
MKAKDKLEGQRSCRSGLTGGEMGKTNPTRLTPPHCSGFGEISCAMSAPAR